MASFYAGMLAELWATIHAACPEIVIPGTSDGSGGFLTSNAFTSVQALQNNLIESIAAGAPAAPYCVIHIGDFPVADEGCGMHNDTMYLPLRVWYIGTTVGGGTPMSAHEKAFLIRQAIDANGHTYFFSRQRGNLNNSETDAVVSAILADLKIPLPVGSVTYSPGLVVGSNVLA